MSAEKPRLTYEDPYITLRGHRPLLFDLGRLIPAVIRLLDPSNKRFDLQSRAMLQEASSFLVNSKPRDIDIWIEDSKLALAIYMLPFLDLGNPAQVTYNKELTPPQSKNGFLEDLYQLVSHPPYCYRNAELSWVPRERATIVGFFPSHDNAALRKYLTALPTFDRAKIFIRNGARNESGVSIELFREHQVWFSTRAEGYIVVEK